MGISSTARLDEFRRVDRIVDAAALQLHPPNFDRIAALTELSARARRPGTGTRRPGVRAWRRWLGSSEARDVLEIEPNGILDRPGAEATVVNGWEIGVVPGRTGDEAVAARLLDGALSALVAGRDDDALQGATRVLRTGLALCHEMVWRADLPTAQWPQHADGEIVVPSAARLDRLRRAVRFRSGELPLDGEPLGPLFDDPSGGEGLGRAWRTPLTPSGQQIVVAQPFALAAATLAQAWSVATTSRHINHVRAAVIARWRVELSELIELCGWGTRPSDAANVVELELDAGTSAALVLLAEPPAAAHPSKWDGTAELTRALERLETDDDERLFIIVATLSFGRVAAVALPDGVPARHCWVLDAHGLQYLLEATRLDPLGLVRAHRQLPATLPPAAAAELLDLLGAVRYLEDTAEPLLPGSDAAEVAIKSARRNAARHPAPRWDDRSAWVEVARSRHADDDRFFVPTVSDGHTRILIRQGDALYWTSSGSPTSSRYGAEAVLTQMTAFWTARLAAVDLLGDTTRPEWHSTVVLFDAQAPGPEAPTTARADEWQVLRFGAAFLQAMARGDNTADRLLAGALLELRYSSEIDAAQATIARAVDIVAPAGPATFAIWNDPEQDELPAPGPDLPRTSRAARRIAGIELTEAVLASGHAGLVRGTSAKVWLDTAVEAGLRALDLSVRASAPDLLRELVRLSGVAAEEDERTGAKHAAHAALGQLPQHGIALREEHLAEPGRARVALRFLVELAHARGPRGAERVNNERIEQLRAGAEAVVEAATASDFAHSGLIDLEVLALPGRPLIVSGTGSGRAAREHQFDLILESAPEASLSLNPAWWDADGPKPPPRLDRPLALKGEWAAVSEAMGAELGFSWDELLRVSRSLADDALVTGGVLLLSRSATIAAAAAATGVPGPTCGAIVAFLELKQPQRYDPRRHPDKPWKTGRDTGYLRRPLLLVGHDELLWSGAHLLLSIAELAKRIELRRMPLPGRRLGKAIDKLRAAGDDDWESTLAQLINELGLDARLRADRVGTRRIAREDGSTLGDVDVLALHAPSKTVWALEAKRVAPALAPLALPNEAARLAAEAEKHAPRVRWLRDNLDAVAAEFGCAEAELADWAVRGALILSAPLAGAFLAEGPVPLLTWEQLRGLLAGHSSEPHH